MKIGQYLLISTTFLGLVNPLAVLADNQVDNINSSTILSDKKNIADKTKGTKDSIDESKVQENDEIVTFDDPALESVVRDALNTKKTDSEPLTQSDFSNYTSGNNFISIDMFYSSPENGPTGPTSLKGLEALKYLPSNINISIEIQNMNSDVSLKPLTGLNNLEDLWLGKASFSDEDIDALNSTHWGDKAHVVGLYGKNDSNVYYNAGGITNDQFKALKPYFDDAYKHGSRMFALDNNQIFDFSQFSEYSNLSVQAINQWQELPNPVQVKDGQKVVSFKSQVKGLDGSPITDSVISTSGALTNNNGEYTINDYTTGRIPDTILVQGERSHDNQLLKHIHNYSNGSKLVQSGTELYKIGEPVKAADVTVKYVDENGKNIEDPTIISGNVDDSFETKQKTFEGYTFHDVKGETSGKLDSQPKTVTYTYYKDDGSNHTVNFYDMNGKKIADEISIDGTYKDAYDLTDQVNKVLIDLKKQGYKQVSNYGLIKGNFVQLHDEADYILTKLPANEVGTVKANYVDEQGNVITDSEIKGGKLGSVYKTEKKSIKGYTFKEVQGNETGKITDKEQTVTYIYTKNPEKGADVTVKYVDENGKEIAKSEVKSGNVGDKYTTEKKDITGYTFKEIKGSANGEFTDKAQTVTYIYTKNPEKGADVTVKYVNENGKKITKSEVKSGNIGDKYTTEKKDIDGYTFKEVKGSANGEFTDKEQTVTYIYTKNDDNVKPSDPSQPAKPDTPNHSGDADKPTDNNSNNSEQPGNNSTGNDVMNNVVEGVQSVLPKTAAEKVTLAGIVSVALASLVGLIVWKRRK